MRSETCRCCGIPPSTAPSETVLLLPNRHPDLMIAWPAIEQLSPIRAPSSIIQYGPIVAAAPSSALGLTHASGWMSGRLMAGGMCAELDSGGEVARDLQVGGRAGPRRTNLSIFYRPLRARTVRPIIRILAIFTVIVPLRFCPVSC